MRDPHNAPATRPIFGWLLLFAALGGMFAAAIYMVPWLFIQLSHRMPENYRYLAREHMQNKQYAEAERILRQRLNQQYYDFEAQHLLAEVQAQSGHPRDAVATMEDTLNKIASSRGRNVRASGYDESITYLQLGSYLWRDGDYVSGGEMLRAALDSGIGPARVQEVIGVKNATAPRARESAARIYLKLHDRKHFDEALNLQTNVDASTSAAATHMRAAWLEDVDKNTTAAIAMLLAAADQLSTPPLLLATLKNINMRNNIQQDAPTTATTQQPLANLDLDRFALVPGIARTSTTLQLARSATTSARFDSGVYRTTSLLLRASGSAALGMFPIVVLRSADSNLARLYLDGLQPAEYDLELWPKGTPKSLQLTMSFENDAFDPVTGADRNADIFEMALH